MFDSSYLLGSRGNYCRRWARALALSWLVNLILAPGGTALGTNDLGATLDREHSAVTFRVFSSRATRIEVWIYNQPFGSSEKVRAEMTVDAQGIWAKTLSLNELAALGVSSTIYYGYRAWGPNWIFDPSWTKGSEKGFITDVDADGNRFNPNKLLLDPYAQEVSHDPKTPRQPDDAIYCSGDEQRASDTGEVSPKGIVLEPHSGDA